jgi:hypothetical protein
VNNQLVEVCEHSIKAAKGTAGILCYIAGSQARQSVGSDAIARCLDQTRPQVLTFFFSSSSH